MLAEETGGRAILNSNDPTLQRSEVDCPQCHHHEAVLIQSTQNVKSNKLTLIFVCCNEHCGHKW